MFKWVVGLACLSLGAAAVAADAPPQAAAPQQLTLQRLFAAPDLSGTPPRAVRLSPDGSLLTLLRARPDERDRYDLWAIDTRTGREWMLVDSKKIGSGGELSEAEKMQRERTRLTGLSGIIAYEWSPDSRTVLVPLDGKLYLASLDGQVRPIGPAVAGLLNPAISPAGHYLSFVDKQNLHVTPVAGGPVMPTTTTGAGTVHWGEAEFVAQEEMERRTGYWWAPDDSRIAVERFDEAPVGIVTRAAIGANGTRVYDQRYPAAGTPNVLVELHVMRPDGSGDVKVDLGPNPDIYLARVRWAPDGRTLYVQRESRDQKMLDVLAVDPASGTSHVLFTERAPADYWINLTDSFRPLKDGSFLWQSERDGYAHLYRFKTGRWTQLTSGPWAVKDVVGVDEAHGRIYFTANKDDVLEQQLYAVDLARPGQVTRITERGWWNDATMDKAASRIIVARSNTGQPPQTYLADTSGKRLAWINENALTPAHPYYPYLASHRPTQFGTITAADGTVLHYEMITPPLEPGKRYPVYFEHYGGPTTQQVSRAWGGAMRQYIVDRGYIYFQIDNRGSDNRGVAFAKQLYHAMGSVEVADQLRGAEWLKQQPFVDPNKIAIYGWSYGGYMTLKMLEQNPGVYAAGVSGAPVTKWELYDTHYTERYLGDPRTDPASYARSDAVEQASAIRDPLLLLHGMSDDNVVFENSTILAARLQAEDRPFEMMFYPGKTHTAGRDIHVWTTIFNFLDDKVKNARPK